MAYDKNRMFFDTILYLGTNHKNKRVASVVSSNTTRIYTRIGKG